MKLILCLMALGSLCLLPAHAAPRKGKGKSKPAAAKKVEGVAAPASLQGGKLVIEGYAGVPIVFSGAEECTVGSYEPSTYTYKAKGSEAELSCWYCSENGPKMYEFSLCRLGYEMDWDAAETPEPPPARLIFTAREGKVLKGFIIGQYLCTNRPEVGVESSFDRVPFTLTLP